MNTFVKGLVILALAAAVHPACAQGVDGGASFARPNADSGMTADTPAGANAPLKTEGFVWG